MSQFTRTVITGSPSTRPSHVKRCAATVPSSSTPTGVSRGRVATAISCVVRFSPSRLHPSAAATMSIDCVNPSPRIAGIGLVAACSGGVPNSITSRTTDSVG